MLCFLMEKIIPPTEKINNKKLFVDEMSTEDALKLMIDDQSEVIKVLNDSRPQINNITKSIFDRLNQSKTGRLIYVGAGTSGRIAVQDGVEVRRQPGRVHVPLQERQARQQDLHPDRPPDLHQEARAAHPAQAGGLIPIFVEDPCGGQGAPEGV